ncbi:hypothetical protein LXL04_015771 [Taraxacum kok-saghyz]
MKQASLNRGVMKTINVNKLTSAGCKVKIWIADCFAQLNNKMGGDLNKIQTVGEYLIEIWKAEYLTNPVQVKVGKVSSPTENVSQNLEKISESEKVSQFSLVPLFLVWSCFARDYCGRGLKK